MAEVGLVRFAQVALDVATATVPRYRTTFSKHQFTQPQLLAILCLMRYEDWTYREAEVRLAEHSELRRALELRSVPDFTTLYRFLRRLEEAAITRALNEVVHRIPLPGPRRRTHVAVDATGLSPGAISTFFVRRMYHHNQQPMPWRHWLKWLVVVDLHRQLLLAQKAHAGPTNDGANLRPLVDTAHTVSSIRPGTGRCGVRQRTQPHPHPPAARGPQRHPRQTRQENLAHPRCPRPDARPLSPPCISPTRAGRKRLLRRQTKTLLPRTRP